MILDALLGFSGADAVLSVQTITGSGSIIGTNNIDLSVNREFSDQTVQFQVATTFTGLTALEMQVIAADDAAMTTNITILGSTGAVPLAQLVAGNRFIANTRTQPGKALGQRYIGVRYVVSGTSSAGTMRANLPSNSDFKTYPNNFTVA
jgi:hypothetical protein